jgi:hypothetical protein
MFFVVLGIHLPPTPTPHKLFTCYSERSKPKKEGREVFIAA